MPSARCAHARSREPLYLEFTKRYLTNDHVRQWLLCRDPEGVRYAETFALSMSYACVYHMPGARTGDAPPRKRRRAGCEDAPADDDAAFVDSGDFMMFHHVQDGFALGSLYTTRHHHALAQLRESVHPTRLSTVPKARRFAIDLSADGYELIEFAWLKDDSLVVNCRRLSTPHPRAGHRTIEGDILFFDVVPQGEHPVTPMKRMTLVERPVGCPVCLHPNSRTCPCAVAYRARRARARAGEPCDLSTSAVTAGEGMQTTAVAPPSLDTFTSNLFDVDQSGAFYVTWFEQVAGTREMDVWRKPRSPIPYQFLCGTRDQTNDLAALFIKEMKLTSTGFRADTRLFHSLTNGAADLSVLVSRPGRDSDRALPELPATGYSAITDTHVAIDSSPAEVVPESEFKDGALEIDATKDDSTEPTAGSQGPMALYTYAIAAAAAASTEEPQFQPFADPANASPPFAPQTSSMLVAAAVEAARVGSSGLSLSSGGLGTAATTPAMSPPFVPSPGSIGLGAELAVDVALGPAVGAMGKRADRGLGQYVEADSGMVSDGVDAARSDSGYSSGGGASSSQGEAQEAHIITGANGLPTCSACKAQFKKNGNLTRHIQTVHLKKKPFECKTCGTCFGYKTHLNRHITTVHNKCNDYKCTDCNREFRTQQQLDRHLAQAHAGSSTSADDEIKCDLCGHGFSQRSNLNRHIQSKHHGLRHRCAACPRSFGQRFDLQRHMQRFAEGGDAPHARALGAAQRR